jgi:glycosyltransferase involved in cell wall biosynthesis
VRGGAVEKVWDALGREFARRGHAVTHLSRWCDGLPEREEIAGVRHVRVRGYDACASGALLKWRDLLYSRRARAALPPADILVTNTFWLPLLAPAPSCGKLCVHVARFPKGQLRFYGNAVRWQCVSQAVADAARRQAPALAERIRVLPNPLPEGAFEPAPSPDAARAPLVLYAGRIHPEKGLDLLAAAWTHPRARAALAGWKLMLVGPVDEAHGGGGERYRAALVERFRPAGDSVEWAGPWFGPDTEKLLALYRRARVFVYPSVAELGESFGLAPLEAMAAGAPAVVSGLACFRDFLRDGENGVVFDHRAADAPERLADALAALAGDPARRARLAAAAWETAGHFRVEEVAGMYLNDFASLLAIPTA